MRDLELDRMDRILRALERKTDAGDTQAWSVAVQVSERRCKLLGIGKQCRRATSLIKEVPI